MASTKNKVSAINSIATFNQKVKFETELLYNNKDKQFVKKEVLLLLNLISARRPDQQKLVGRVSIDLSQVFHTQHYAELQEHKLYYCSVNAHIVFNMKCIGKRISNTLPENFERDSFSDFQSFVAGLHKDSINKQRSFQEGEKTIQMPWKTNANEKAEKNKVIEESMNEDVESRLNTGRENNNKIITNQEHSMKPVVLQGLNEQIPSHRFASGRQVQFEPILKNNSMQNKYASVHYDSGNFQNMISRVQSDLPQRSYSTKNLHQNAKIQQQIPYQIHSNNSQYEQILRNNHSEEKRIWQQQKRLLNDQISREKLQSIKYKERNDSLEKKVYETEMKLCNLQSKIENFKREMTILEKQKDLQIKELKSNIERITKERNEKSQLLQIKQAQIRELKEKLRAEELERKLDFDQISKQNERLQEKLQNALKTIQNLEDKNNKGQKQIKEGQSLLMDSERKNMHLLNEINQLKLKIREIQANFIEKTFKSEKEFQDKYEREEKILKLKIEKLEKILSATESKLQQKQTVLSLNEQKLYQLSTQLEKKSSILLQNQEKINQLIIELESKQATIMGNEVKINELNTELDNKDAELKKKASEFSQNLLSNKRKDQEQMNQLLSENQKEIQGLNTKILELQAIKQQLQFKINSIEGELERKNEQIQQLIQKNEAKVLEEKQKQENNRQYIKCLEENILQWVDKLKEKKEQNNSLTLKVQELTNQLSNLKQQEKSLKQELLQNHNLQQKIGALTKNEKEIAQKYIQFEAFATKRIAQLQEIIEKQNVDLNEKNHETENLKRAKNEFSEYILGLESELLKQKGNIENINEDKLRMENELNVLTSQGKYKDAEIQLLKETADNLREYINSLEKEILKIKEEVTQLQSKNHNLYVSFGVGNNLPKNNHKKQENSNDEYGNKIKKLEQIIVQQKQHIGILEQELQFQQQPDSTSRQTQLEQKIKVLKAAFDQQKQHARELELKLLSQSQTNQTSSKNEELQQKIAELEQRLEQQIQYTEGLEEKILEDHQQLTQSRDLKQSLTNIQREMASKIRELEHIIEQQKLYQSGLEQQILQMHERQQKSEELKNKIKELQAQISQQKEYQQGLEQKILQDHEKGIQLIRNTADSSNKEMQLAQRIKQLQDKVEYQKQYQQGLQQKILDDHQQVVEVIKNGLHENQKQLVNKIKTLENAIEKQKEYQEGLEQRILEDHDNLQNHDDMKESLGLLNTQLQHHKQYQEGLEQKILTDHEKLEIMEKKYNELLATSPPSKRESQDSSKAPKQSTLRRQLRSNSKNEELVHKKCQEERKKLEQIIEQLENNLYKMSENEGIKNEDEDYLFMQEKIDEKEAYIEELETTLRAMEQQAIKLKQKIAQLQAEKEDLIEPNRKKEHQYQNYHYQEAFGTVIRVISAHTPSEYDDEDIRQEKIEQQNPNQLKGGLTALMRRSVQKSQISQPPNLIQDQAQDQSDNLSYKSSPRKGELMCIDDFPKKPASTSNIIYEKQFKQRERQRKISESESMLKNKQQQIRQLKLAIQVRDFQLANLNKTIQQLKIANQKLAKNAQIQQQKPNLKQQSNIIKLQAKLNQIQQQKQKYEKESKIYQIKVKELENAMDERDKIYENIEIRLQESREYTDELENLNKEYENRIIMLKEKQAKIETALLIIEEESHKIVGEIEEKEKQRNELKSQLEQKTRQCQQLNNKLNQILFYTTKQNEEIQINKSYISNLLAQKQMKDQQISELMKKLSLQAENTQKYEDFITEIQASSLKAQEKLKKDEEKIKKLELQVNNLNEQLTTNRKLFAKFKEPKENSKNVELETKFASVLEENRNLQKKIEELQKYLHDSQKNEDEKHELLQKLADQVKTLTEKLSVSEQKASSQSDTKLQQAIQQIQRLKKLAQQHREKIKHYQAQLPKIQVLMKSQRLEYFNKRKQIIQQKQQANNEIQILKQKLEENEKQMNELKGELILTHNKLREQEELNKKDTQDMKKSISENEEKLGKHMEELELKRKESMKYLEYIKELEKVITEIGQKIKEKDEQIQRLKNAIKQAETEEKQTNQLRQIQDELNFYSEQLALMTKRYEQLQSKYNSQASKLEESEKYVEELTSQLLLAQQQNQFQQKSSKKIARSDSQDSKRKKLQQQHLHDKNILLQKLQQIQIQFDDYKLSSEEKERVFVKNVAQLEEKLRRALDEKDKAIEQLQEKQMEQLNSELDFQFKLREKNEKSQNQMARSMSENHNRKSINESVDAGTSDVVPASKILKQILITRTDKTTLQKQLEVMIMRINHLQQQLFNAASSAKQKGLILEKSRLISMQFSKFKVSIMKSKLNNEEKIQYLHSLRPVENSIKEILRLSEIHSENLLGGETGGSQSRN